MRRCWELLFLAVLAPFFLFPPLHSLAIAAILLLPLPWLVAVAAKREPLAATPLNGAVAGLIVMVAVSLIVTPDRDFSAPKVLGVTFGVSLLFAVVRCPHPHALDLFGAAGAGVAIVGLLGTNWIGKLSFITSLTSFLPPVIRGVPGQAEGFQPNAIAGTLAMFIPLQIALVLTTARSSIKVLRWVVLLLTVGVLILCQSRGAWLALFFALAGWAVLRSKRWVRVTALALVAVLVVISLVVVAGRVRIERLGSGLNSDVATRLDLWSRAVTAIGDFPLTGMGMNMFRRVMPAMYPAMLTPPEIDVAHAHNQLLQTALDLGLPGLAAYLMMWFGIAKVVRESKDPAMLALAVGLAAFFFFGIADAIALGAKLGIFFWIAVGLILGLRQEDEAPASASIAA